MGNGRGSPDIIREVSEIGLPKSEYDTNRLFKLIAELDFTIQEAEQERARQIKQTNQEADEIIKPYVDAIERAKKNIFRYGNRNRKALTRGKRRSVSFKHGTIRWRWGKPRLEITASESDVAKELEAFGCTDCISWKPRIDKHKLKQRPDIIKRLKGARMVQEEFLEIIPKMAKKRFSQKISTKKK
jgi:phage host-nuclease inhibitor protein Gam